MHDVSHTTADSAAVETRLFTSVRSCKIQNAKGKKAQNLLSVLNSTVRTRAHPARSGTTHTACDTTVTVRDNTHTR